MYYAIKFGWVGIENTKFENIALDIETLNQATLKGIYDICAISFALYPFVKDCVFTCYDEKGYCYCAIEKAFRAGKTDFYKPISCHLYPIRIGDYGPYKAVNYHRWNVCKAAVLLGQKENLPVYKFLKEPLVRKFGEEWYKELEIAAEELQRRGMM
jgi:hypothetical protein